MTDHWMEGRTHIVSLRLFLKGFAIDPVRIEFMQFRHDRFHERRVFEKVEEGWEVRLLQP